MIIRESSAQKLSDNDLIERLISNAKKTIDKGDEYLSAQYGNDEVHEAQENVFTLRKELKRRLAKLREKEKEERAQRKDAKMWAKRRTTDAFG